MDVLLVLGLWFIMFVKGLLVVVSRVLWDICFDVFGLMWISFVVISFFVLMWIGMFFLMFLIVVWKFFGESEMIICFFVGLVSE